jgi:hypothetical protein
MFRLRKMVRFTPMLVVLFMVTQFAGVVPSPMAQAHGAAVVHTGHHHSADRPHASEHRHDGCAHPDSGTCDHADYCCALHAFFVGILPPAATLDNAVSASETLRPTVTNAALGHRSDRLDRPPRPLS